MHFYMLAITILVYLLFIAYLRKVYSLHNHTHNGAVDESYIFVNWTRLPLLCEKSGAILLVLVGLTAGQQSDEMLVDF